MPEEKITIYRARWVVPMSRPEIEGGAVAVRGGIITDVGDSSHILETHKGEVVDLGDGILLPGFVNAHTHLELSALKGKVGGGAGFVDWVRQVMLKRMELPGEQIESALLKQVHLLSSSGTVLLGEVTNTGLSQPLLSESGLRATVFHEVIGFNGEDADDIFSRALTGLRDMETGGRLRTTMSPHGPHSVSTTLIRKISAYVGEGAGGTMIHLAESREENLFIREGRGPFRDFLDERGVWDPSWVRCPRGPVSYLDGLGFLRPGTLCVHLAQADEEDLRLLARRGAAACICPRSNSHTGVGPPPVEAMLKAGLKIALGTDSLASVGDLNILAEAQYLHGMGRGIEPRTAVSMFTRNGAEALGWSELGSISEGKIARFALAPVLSGPCGDPYEYLLERIDPEEVKVV